MGKSNIKHSVFGCKIQSNIEQERDNLSNSYLLFCRHIRDKLKEQTCIISDVQLLLEVSPFIKIRIVPFSDFLSITGKSQYHSVVLYDPFINYRMNLLKVFFTFTNFTLIFYVFFYSTFCSILFFTEPQRTRNQFIITAYIL